MRYRVLLLPNRHHMTPATLAAIARLVEAGATVIGPRPLRSPSLSGQPEADAAVRGLADQVWGQADGLTITENRHGKGRVIVGRSLGAVLAELAPPDFEFTPAAGEGMLRYIHRQVDHVDQYFVANADDTRPLEAAARFRVTGRAPELWDPATGAINRPAVHRSVGGVTELPLHLDPAGSVFVVFRQPAEAGALVAVDRGDEPVFPLAPVAVSGATVATAANNADLSDTFAMAFAVKPAQAIELPGQGLKGVRPASLNFAVYPVAGHEVFGDGQVGIGVAAGTNGIVVIAHGARVFAPLLVHAADLADLSHQPSAEPPDR
jgi:hypothetical protein